MTEVRLEPTTEDQYKPWRFLCQGEGEGAGSLAASAFFDVVTVPGGLALTLRDAYVA